MTLRRKTLLIIGATLFGVVAVLYVVSSTLVLGSFVQLEEQDIYQNVEQAQDALSGDLAELAKVARDYAAWDDSYAFIEDGNVDYITTNLIDATFDNLNLNLILYVDVSGRVVFGKAFDLAAETEAPVPESVRQHLSSGDRLLQHASEDSSLTGIILLPEGTLLVASQPILTSDYTGPVRGTLIFGRYLNATELERLAEVTHLSLTVRRVDDVRMPSDFQTAQSAVSEAAPILVRPLSADSVAGYTLLKDVYGAPALVLRVDSPRTIYAQGQAALLYFYLALLAVGLVFSLVAMLLADKLILSRLAHLHSSVSQIGASGDLSARVSMTGRDELSSLGNAVDGMLMALEHAELEHRQQEALRSDEERMRHRATQLQAVAEVARAITSVQNLEVLLPQVTHLISDRFGFYHVGVFLLDEAGEYAILKAANSEGGLRMLAREHKLKVGQSGVIGRVTGSGQARIASDVGQDATFFNNPDLPLTLSEMALPLKVRDQIIGALDVQSTHEAAFTDENVTLLNTLADQVAIAIENARSFERQVALVVDNRQLLKRAEKAVEDLNTLTRRLTGEGWRQYLIEQGGELVLEDAHPGLAVGQRALPELDLAAERAELVTAAGDGRSAIAFPIALRGEVIGTLGLEDIEADREWSADEIAVIKDVAEHVALALDNARLFQRTETALAETRRLAQHRQLINQVTTKMRAAMSVDEVLRIAADELRQATRASRAVARLGELAPVDGKGQEGIEGIEETL